MSMMGMSSRIPFAFGAGKDIKQFLTDHGVAPVDGKWRRMWLFLAAGNTGVGTIY